MEVNDIRALEAILKVLEPLSDDDRVRVLRWTQEKLGLGSSAPAAVAPYRTRDAKEKPTSVDLAFNKHPQGFRSISEFVAAAQAKTDIDRVLVAAVYLQDMGEDPNRTLSGKEINDNLKDLGHGVKNITDCINKLKARSPQHVIQTRKGGSARQAWKEYRATQAGCDYVYKLISEAGNEAKA